MKKHAMWFAALVLGAVVAVPADAQTKFGGQLSYGLDVEALAVGARVEIGLPNKLSQQGPISQARFVGSLDYFFPDCGGADSCSVIEINPGLVVPFQGESMKPYLGAGLNWARTSFSGGGTTLSDSETGINVIGGLTFMLSGMDAFTEARLALGGTEQLVLSFGLLFGGSGSGN